MEMIKRKNVMTPLKFGLVGVINTLVDVAVFSLLFYLIGMDKVLCQGAAYCAGVGNSYFMNREWTFKDQSDTNNIAAQFAKFITINLVTLGISIIALNLLCDVFGLQVPLAKLLVVGITMFSNYVGYKLLVFTNLKVKILQK